MQSTKHKEKKTHINKKPINKMQIKSLIKQFKYKYKKKLNDVLSVKTISIHEKKKSAISICKTDALLKKCLCGEVNRESKMTFHLFRKIIYNSCNFIQFK